MWNGAGKFNLPPHKLVTSSMWQGKLVYISYLCNHPSTPSVPLVSISHHILAGCCSESSCIIPYAEPILAPYSAMDLELEPYFAYPGEMASVFCGRFCTQEPLLRVIFKCYGQRFPATSSGAGCLHRHLSPRLHFASILWHLAPLGMEWAGLGFEYTCVFC
jgi:hypothetical protein